MLYLLLNRRKSCRGCAETFHASAPWQRYIAAILGYPLAIGGLIMTLLIAGTLVSSFVRGNSVAGGEFAMAMTLLGVLPTLVGFGFLNYAAKRSFLNLLAFEDLGRGGPVPGSLATSDFVAGCLRIRTS